MMSIGNIFCWNVFIECFFHFQWRIGSLGHKSHPVTNTINMRIYSHCCLSKPHRLHHICSLSPYTRKLHKVFPLLWYFSIKLFYQYFCHLHKMFCLCIGIAHTTYILKNLIHFCFRHRQRCGISCKQFGGYLVYSFIGTLCT